MPILDNCFISIIEYFFEVSCFNKEKICYNNDIDFQVRGGIK